jgi:chaperonin cofactor prefoldin
MEEQIEDLKFEIEKLEQTIVERESRIDTLEDIISDALSYLNKA